MPPKKKAGKKSKKKKEVDPEEKLRQELLLRALSLQGEAAQEDALEKQLSKQSELVKGFWEIEKRTREERNRTLREKEHRLRDVGDKHRIDLGECKQTIKRLLFANQDQLSERTVRSFAERQSLSDRQGEEVGRHNDELRGVADRIRETDASHDGFKISVRGECDDGASALREDARRRIATLAAYSEERFKRTRAEAERSLAEETRALERKNEEEIRGVMEKNNEEIQRMRTEYNAIMNGNLDAIAELRKEVVLLRERDRHDRLTLGELRSRNDDIVIPLEENRKSLHRLESDLDAFHERKRELDEQKARLRRSEEELKEIEWDHEVLFQKLQASELDRDKWKKEAQDSVHSARQRANFRNLVLERKLSRLTMTGEKNTAAMAEILQTGANIDLKTLDQSQVRVTDVVDERNGRVASLRKKLKDVKDARARMIEKHKKLMEETKVKAIVQTAA